MNKMIVISNDGLMDIEALRLMGVSSKRANNTKIGMFGTGMKYAIARLLKLDIPFELWIGTNKVEITKKAGILRDQAYEQIVIDGQPTSITTDMGPQWEPWTIVREILSNARDEAMPEFYVAKREEWNTVSDRTTFLLDYKTFEDVWLNREKYFVQDREPLFENNQFRILKKLGEGTRVYKNGILVLEQPAEDVFDYDLLTIELNEMREARYDWMASSMALQLLTADLSDKELITQWLNGMNSHLRYGKTAFCDASFLLPCTAWQEVIEKMDVKLASASAIGGAFMADTNSLVLPAGLVEAMKGKVRIQQRAEIPMSTEQRLVLDQSLIIMFEGGFRVQHSIVMCDLGPTILGEADTTLERIILTPRVLANVQECVRTLLEEELHLRTGFRDCTQKFQDAILDDYTRTLVLNAHREPQNARSHEESNDRTPTGE